MKETEAKEKICCASMASETVINCKGSTCMAWVWSPMYGPDRYPYPHEFLGYSTTEGYCGLVKQ